MAEPFSTNILEPEVKNSSELSSTNRGKRNTTQPANLDLITGKWQAALGTGTATGKICHNSDTLISLSSCCIFAFISMLMPWNLWHHFYFYFFFPFASCWKLERLHFYDLGKAWCAFHTVLGSGCGMRGNYPVLAGGPGPDGALRTF